MTLRPDLSSGVLPLLFGGAVLLLVLLVAGRISRIVPMRKSRRKLLLRLSPAVGAVVGIAYALVVVRRIFSGTPEAVPFAMALFVLGISAAGWFAIRDLFAGVFLKSGRVLDVGDRVQIGDIRGRVGHLGYRVASIETDQGDEALIPYRKLASEAILRTPVIEGVALHAFRVPVPGRIHMSEVRRVIRHSALLCHWASIVREPDIVLLGGEELEVTVFAIDPDRAPEVEAAVRSALARASVLPKGPDAS